MILQWFRGGGLGTPGSGEGFTSRCPDAAGELDFLRALLGKEIRSDQRADPTVAEYRHGETA
jgi:hypothetical protein